MNILRMKVTQALAVIGLGLSVLFSTTAALAVDVTCSAGSCVSSNSGGLWNSFDYGDCFYMLPTATLREVELPIGPGAIATASSAEACIGGDLTTAPDISVRVSRSSNPEENAYSWSYGSTYPFNPGAAQFIPADCNIGDLDSQNPDRRNGTFDNGDKFPTAENPTPIRPVLEPLSAEFTLSGSVTGNATLSYYFMNGSDECRELNWSLKVDAGSGLSEVLSGTIGDFEGGKYLEFNLAGLTGSETIRLDMINPDGAPPVCADAAIEGVNSVISGIFISGTSVCAPPPFCGDGNVDPGETCEKPGDAIDPLPVTGPQTCSDNCNYCGDGFTDPGEECDPTNPQDPNLANCGNDCTILPYCGDGIVDSSRGETCDPPGSTVPSTDGGVCRQDCSYCGDGATNNGEACDPTDPSVEAGTCTDTCEPVVIEPLGCRFTGGLNDVFITENEKENRYSAGGQVGANTGQQPQPKGEWTHRQRSGPAGMFTFHGGTASAPVGSEIDVIRCSDPGGCKPSGDPPSPVKQLDFDGIGTFKNIGKTDDGGIPDFVKAGTNNVTAEGNGNKTFDGTLHWFEVNIDDLGEPGNTNPKQNPGDANSEICPSLGFGEKGAEELGDCSCSDFYRITIYDGVDAVTVPRNADGSIDKADMNTEDVIYEVWGYIDGGNLQLHRPTGFDVKLLAE